MENRVALVRCDFNISMDGDNVRDTRRIVAHRATIQKLCEDQAKVVLLSHRGRPKGREVAKSLRVLIPALKKSYATKIHWLGDITDGDIKARIEFLKGGEVGLVENLRFHEGEEKGDESFTKHLASLGDVFVNDAFSVCHRPHASVSGVAHFLPSYGGMSLTKELTALEEVWSGEGRVMAVIGGAKISTKLGVLAGLLKKVDVLVVVGAMAHTFLLLRGYNLGLSLVEKSLCDAAANIESQARSLGVELIVANDVVVENKNGQTRMAGVETIKEDEKALDVGEKTLAILKEKIKKMDKVIWNGPLGYFEDERFIEGTRQFVEMFSLVTAQGGLTLAGGGDTLAAMTACGLSDENTHKVSYISTAGGAFLEWLEGRSLPGVEVLEVKKIKQ